MVWNDLSREQMEAQLLRQAQTIGKLREALQPFADLSPMHDDITTPPMVEVARRALGLHKNGERA